MSAATRCPGVAALNAWVAGSLPAPEALTIRTHVEACDRCRRDVEALTPDTEPEPEPQSEIEQETGSFEPETRTTMLTTVALGEPTKPSRPRRDRAAGVSLGFLAPPRKPGSLGRIGRYEVLGLLGRGGMGIVLKAEDARLGRIVAVKVLDPNLASRHRARRRFLREARAAAAINHPNVVTVHEVGTHAGLPFLVMEYIRGRTLRQRIRQAATPSAEEVARVAAQVAAGLTAAHEQGIIHRDINPANIMLEGRVERVKITDFGLARVTVGLSELSSGDRVLGTPAYMSPQQVAGGPIDARTDQFSLGCVLYTMLVGRSPFRGGHPVEIVRRVCDEHPPAPSTLNPACPPELDAIVMRLLEKDPDRRFPDTRALAEALRPLVSRANLADSTEADPTPRAAAPKRPINPEPRPAPRRPRVEVHGGVLALALAALVLLAAALLLVVRRNPDDSAQATLEPTPEPPRIATPHTSPRRDPAVLTIARRGAADYRSLADALQHAQPGDTLRILDSARYEGALILDDPERFAGLTVEAAPGARPTLASAVGHKVVDIVATPNVTLRGLDIQPASRQFGVHAAGLVEGLTLENLHLKKSSGVPWALVYLSDGAHGSLDHPIVVRGSRFEDARQGLVLQGDTSRAVAHVRVFGNLFLDLEQHLELLQNLQDVRVADNRFVGGGSAVWVNLPPQRGRDLIVEHNSTLDVDEWLGTADSVPDQGSILIRDNAILGRASSSTDGLLASFVESWSFEGNLREAGPEGPDAHAVPVLEVLSRDPENPRFLVPTARSALRAGGDDAIVGARPDAPEGPSDPIDPDPEPTQP